jgi:hypothetical protein
MMSGRMPPAKCLPASPAFVSGMGSSTLFPYGLPCYTAELTHNIYSSWKQLGISDIVR